MTEPDGAGRRIALFLPSLAGGGAERVFLDLAGGFRQRGVAVDVVLARREGPLLAQVPEGVRVVGLGARRTFTAVAPLARYLRRVRPVALLSGITHANIVAVLAARTARSTTRIGVTEHLPLSTWTGHTPVRRERMMPRLIRYVYPRADAIIAVSSGVADDISRVSGIRRSSIDVIYNPVIAERLERRASEPLDDPWYAEGQPPVVLGIGRLAPQKDFTTLIDAVAHARERIECRLEILGEGDQRRSLEAHVRERGMDGFVRLPGFVANPYPRLRGAAVLALSSKREGLPTVLLEGLCLGVPMVSTDCRSGPSELLDGGRLGRLVPVGDAAALGDAIAATLLEPPHLRDPAEMERYRLDRVVAAYAEHLGL